MLNTIFILLGANLGEPVIQLEKARKQLSIELGEITQASSIYESEAWGIEDQPVFMNQVIQLKTKHNPFECLNICQNIENELGRIREKKWGARIIDIDILYYNNEIVNSETLTIPHPYLHLRNFTLLPLTEISPDYIHPKYNESNKKLLLNSGDNLQVKKTNLKNGISNN